jgi:hypothetical protein
MLEALVPEIEDVRIVNIDGVEQIMRFDGDSWRLYTLDDDSSSNIEGLQQVIAEKEGRE